nr:MAG TPA: hypothetical protein [Caudoviricetes sp.]
MARYYRLTKIFSCLRILFYSIMPVIQSTKISPPPALASRGLFCSVLKMD